MSNFNKRITAPSKSNKFYYKNNIFYTSGYGLPNCTCYAWGRWYELLNKKPKLCTRNAENWYGFEDGYKRGNTPKLGAIAVWSKGKIGNGKDGAGHVAVVEQIKSDGSIVVSNSAYKSTLFYLKTYKPPYKIRGYSFLGFIYLPKEYKEDKQLTYIVKKGDNLSKIAKKYNTTWQKIYTDNKKVIGSNPNLIKVGMKLVIK